MKKVDILEDGVYLSGSLFFAIERKRITGIWDYFSRDNVVSHDPTDWEDHEPEDVEKYIETKKKITEQLRNVFTDVEKVGEVSEIKKESDWKKLLDRIDSLLQGNMNDAREKRFRAACEATNWNPWHCPVCGEFYSEELTKTGECYHCRRCNIVKSGEAFSKNKKHLPREVSATMEYLLRALIVESGFCEDEDDFERFFLAEGERR